MKKKAGKNVKNLAAKPQLKPIHYSVILFVFTFLIYSNSVFNDYNLDDELVTRSHKLTSQGLKAIPKIFASPYVDDNMGVSYEYRPVVLTSFAIEHQFFGENPHTSHFINVLLYAISILVLFKLLRLLFPGQGVFFAFIVSVVFAAHPVHTEVVASIKNRDEVLALLFGFLSWIYAYKYVKNSSSKLLIPLGIFYTLALMSKQSLLSFALIIPFYIVLFTNSKVEKLIISTAILAAITAVLAPFYNFSHKFVFALALFLAPLVLWLLLNKTAHIKSTLTHFFKSGFSKSPIFKDRFVLKLNTLQTTLIIFLIILFTVIGVLYNQRVLFYMSVVIVLVLYLLTVARIQLYFFTLFMFLIAFIAFNYTSPHVIAFCLVWVLFMYFFVEKKLKLYLLVSLFFLSIPWVIHLKYEGVFWLVYMAFIMWLFQKDKLRIFAWILLVVFFVSSPLVSFLRGLEVFKSVHLYSFVLLSISFVMMNRFKSVSWAKMLIIAVIPIALITKMSSMPTSYSIVIANYADPATIISKGADYLPAGGRDLDKVEVPLSLYAPLGEKVGTAAIVLAEYVRLIVFPKNLGFYYGYKYIEPLHWTDTKALLSLLLHFAFLILAVYYYKRHPILTFGILFYLISIAVFTNIIAPLPGLMADRFAYTPSLGFALVLGHVIYRSKSLFQRIKADKILLIAIVLLYAYKTYTRNFDWENHLSLFRKDIAFLDKSAQAHNLLATNLVIYALEEKNLQKAISMRKEAVVHYKRALEIYPDFFNASFDLSRTYKALNYNDSALMQFRRTTKIRPDFYESYLQIAYIYHQAENREKAILYYYKTLNLKPDVHSVYGNLTHIYFTENKHDSVIALNKRYLEVAPGNKQTLIHLLRASFQINDFESAAYYADEILRIDPYDTDAKIAKEEAEINRALFD